PSVSQLPVGFLQLLGSEKVLSLHLIGARAQLLRELVLFGSLLFEPYEVAHIFDTVDDVKNLASLAADRKVARTPVPFLESAAFGLGAANVVLLHGHRVRSPIPQNPIQRCAEVLDSRSIRIIGVVGEYFEQASPD